MLRLTLLSGRDGHLLGRVVESNGRPFVLDQGDPQLVEDLVQRLNHGFTVIRSGEVIHVSPDDPNILGKLASYYAGKGALVFLEEPNWPGRDPEAQRKNVARLPVFDDDDPTESIGFRDLPSVDESMHSVSPDDDTADAPTEDAADAPTEPVPRPLPKELIDEVEADDFGLLPGVPKVGRS